MGRATANPEIGLLALGGIESGVNPSLHAIARFSFCIRRKDLPSVAHEHSFPRPSCPSVYCN
ncbi:MAG: hypothetical protein KBT64_10885, partial [Sulfitobacter litoralis]|nr:hypothetical protein [Sulfitobacter litoralis]